MDVNELRSVFTVLSLLCFLGICAWVYTRRNRENFEEAAHLPFQSE